MMIYNGGDDGGCDYNDDDDDNYDHVDDNDTDNYDHVDDNDTDNNILLMKHMKMTRVIN